MEKAGYAILLIVAVVWLAVITAGLVAAFPFGLVGLAVIAGVGLLFAKALRDRIANAKDDRYSRDVEI